MERIRLCVPSVARRGVALADRPAIRLTPATRLGLLDNGKPNAKLLLAEVADMLAERYGMRVHARVSKPAAGFTATEAEYEELAGADLVLTATGD